jgi:hypothetical protein
MLGAVHSERVSYLTRTSLLLKSEPNLDRGVVAVSGLGRAACVAEATRDTC